MVVKTMMALRASAKARRAFGAGFALFAGLMATPALADIGPLTAYYNEPALGPSSVQFKLDVLASVGGRCGFAAGQTPGGTIQAGAIDESGWTGDAVFVPECSALWRIAVSSLNGALKSDATTSVQGFADRAPYSVALHVVHDTGTIDRSCPVDQIGPAGVAGQCDFRGTASAANGLQVPRAYDKLGSYLRASAPVYAGTSRLVAGTYSDTLTITISPAS